MKERGLIFVALFFIFIGISYANAIVLHQASDFRIDVDSNSINLQEATDSGYLGGIASSYASSSMPLFRGEHDASKILVNVDGVERDLISALSAFNGLCASEAYTTYDSSNIPDPGHTAEQIQLSSGETLQEAINNGDFCECTPGTQKSCLISSLSTACTTYADYVTCEGDNCNVTCGSESIWPSCNIESYASRGTSCNSDGWHSCNGTGICEGWSSSGCGSCPFGYRDVGSCSGGDNYICNLGPRYQGRGDMDSGNGFRWSSWSTSEYEVWCHRCKFCFFGWCWSDENVDWQIKPI